MSDTVIKVENLSKQYRIGKRQQGYKTFREAIVDTLRAPFKLAKTLISTPSSLISPLQNTIWALKDVSFEVKQGEVVGIIGRNGAGKSTLLKVLSKITEPTKGKVELIGRVGSLLEIGTGFHPELTAHENIYLYGAILGMGRREVTRKFDEIVAFAEIEKFINTPVKRYSSGMYMRLAFSVAAFMETEILLVDEVLAVGDAAFQRKCLNMIDGFGQQERTVLFVSHNMSSIERLCNRVILMDQGKYLDDNIPSEVISNYLESDIGPTAVRKWGHGSTAPGNEIVRLRALSVCTENGTIRDTMDIRYPVGIKMEYEVKKDGHILVPNYHIFNGEGIHLFVTNDRNSEWYRKKRVKGRYVSIAWIPGNFLAEGKVVVNAAVSTLKPVRVHFYERDAVGFQVVDNFEGGSARGDYRGTFPGVIRPILNWETEQLR